MIAAQDANEPRPETLVEIIHAQTEIAKLGLDLGAVMDFVGQVRSGMAIGWNGGYLELGSVNMRRSSVRIGQLELCLGWRHYGTPARGVLLRLATQVQARTQQRAAETGHGSCLLGNTHGPNLAAGEGAVQ